MRASKIWRRLFALALVGAAAAATAAIEIQIESQGVRRIPLLIEPFYGEEIDSNQYSRVVKEDLERTGLFRVIHAAEPTTAPHESPDFDALLADGHEYVLVGLVEQEGVSQLKLTFQLVDLVTQQADPAWNFVLEPGQERTVAHSLADWIYERLTGLPGIFNSKIAYILRIGPKDKASYELKVADYDGHNSQTLLASNEPIISPEWTADGEHLLYVSYEQRKPIVYRHTLISGDREVVAAFKGNNSAPSVSSDRRWYAVALSEEGNTQIFLLSADGTRKLKLRSSNGIDTEPTFSPDNANIAFVSDATGTPQIYVRNRLSGDEYRLTAGSRYNVSPRYSPDGGRLTYIRRDRNGFNVHVIDPRKAGSTSIPLTGIDLADAPSFSPDGSMVLFKNDSRPDILYTVSISDKIVRPFTMPESGEIKDPVWGPASSSWF